MGRTNRNRNRAEQKEQHTPQGPVVGQDNQIHINTGEVNDQPNEDHVKLTSCKKQDPEWAKTNPEDFAAYFDANQIKANYIHGAKYPWAVAMRNRDLVVSYGGNQHTWQYSYSNSGERAPLVFKMTWVPTLGSVLNGEVYSLSDPLGTLGKLMYQKIGTLRKSALPVDHTAISLYLEALRSIVAQAARIHRVLKVCAFTERHPWNLLIQQRSLLAALGLSQDSINKLLLPEAANEAGWKQLAAFYNSIIGMINQMTAPSNLSVYKRAWFLNNWFFKEMDFEERFTSYLFDNPIAYKIDWSGDRFGTKLDAFDVNATDAWVMARNLKEMVDALTGYNYGADDAINVKSALGYLFDDSIMLDTFDLNASTSIDDIFTSSDLIHSMIHNARILNQVRIGVIKSDAQGVLSQEMSFAGPEIAPENYWPVIWDIMSAAATSDEAYEMSTLCPIYQPADGKFSCGTELLTSAQIFYFNSNGTINNTGVPYYSFQDIDRENVIGILAASSFGNRPMRWFYRKHAIDDDYTGLSLVGTDYDTTNFAIVPDHVLDGMHWCAIKSYYGLKDANTLDFSSISKKVKFK